MSGTLPSLASPYTDSFPAWLSVIFLQMRSSFFSMFSTSTKFHHKDSLPAQGRVRDALPVALVDASSACVAAPPLRDLSERDLSLVLVVANLGLEGVCHLAGMPCLPPSDKSTGPQCAVQSTILCKSHRMLTRLANCSAPLEGRLAFADLISDVGVTGSRSATLVADQCDLLEHSGGCDPLVVLPPKLQSFLRDPGHFFPNVKRGFALAARVRRDDRREYARLVMLQLRAGKVCLLPEVHAAASIFPVGKTGGRLREVWSGDKISRSAVPPLPPPHIASQTALLNLEASVAKPIRVWKRDARCYFDQLALPPELRQWFGRPSLAAHELLGAGMSWKEILFFWPHTSSIEPSTTIHPCCSTWPMGFSWSSFLAQSYLLSRCVAGGLNTDMILCDDLPPPSDLDLTFALATDDVGVFARGERFRGDQAVRKLDESIIDGGVQPHPAKSVNAQLDATCIGVDICSGIHLAPS